MSINSITDRFGKKLNLYAENIDSEALLADSVDATLVTAETCFSTSYPQSAADITEYNATSAYVLSEVTPPGFVSEVPASYTIHREEKKAYNTNTSLYKYTLDIKGMFQLLVGIPPSAAESLYSMTFDVENRYLNSIVVYKQGKALNILTPGNVYLDVYQLASVDTSVVGKVKIVFRRDNHNNTPVSSTLINDFHIELVAF
jgi:hypothetical protein